MSEIIAENYRRQFKDKFGVETKMPTDDIMLHHQRGKRDANGSEEVDELTLEYMADAEVPGRARTLSEHMRDAAAARGFPVPNDDARAFKARRMTWPEIRTQARLLYISEQSFALNHWIDEVMDGRINVDAASVIQMVHAYTNLVRIEGDRMVDIAPPNSCTA